MTLPCKVEQYMDRHRMLDGCDTVVAAVSGGADSTAMLRMLKDLCARRGRALVCAHFNHSLRGADSDADEAFVRELCLQFQIPFFSEKRDVRALGGNLESSAREVRYAFLQRTAAGFPAARIATAHTMNDNAETVLFHMSRGAGAQGMQGIAPVRGAVIRPLLCQQRAEIEQYLREAGQSYRTDASNADLAYSRNRIRHAVVPELCRINPRALEHISRMCELLAADAAVLDRLADDVYREAEKGDALLVSVLKAQPRPIRYRVLKQFLLERTGITYDQAHMHTLEALLQSGQTGSRTQLSGDIFCELRYGALYVGTSPAPAAPLEPVLVQPGASCLAGAWRISLRLEDRRHADPRNALDYAKLSGPLTIRSMRSGDRFSIPGVGSKPVRRLYTDRKLPLPARGINPLLTAGERVAWIMGVGPSADCRPDNTTKQYLNIYIKEISNEG